jgi:hypothetical protein
MSYQYLFCATCNQRRTGHAFRCSVCSSLLRRPSPTRTPIRRLEPIVRHSTDRKLPAAA